MYLCNMRIVIQRVTEASVSVDQKVVGEVGLGYMILVGVEDADTQEDADWLAKKVVALRVFSDTEGVMNFNINQVGGSVLAISQFTLYASYKKNNRPSWFRAAKGDISEPLYRYFCDRLEQLLGAGRVSRGVFGADIQVSLVNDGPVTILMDTKNKE